jgi:hypothetical protein
MPPGYLPEASEIVRRASAAVNPDAGILYRKLLELGLH